MFIAVVREALFSPVTLLSRFCVGLLVCRLAGVPKIATCFSSLFSCPKSKERDFFLRLREMYQMIKRLCRKLGMPRWPYRQIDSINKSMEDLQDQLEGARNEADRAR